MTLSRRALLGACLALPSCWGRQQRLGPASTGDCDLVDLTHTLGPSSPYIEIPNSTFPFRRTPIATLPERGVYANAWTLTEHIGTHTDAPCHFAEHGPCLEDVPLADLFVKAIVVDIQERARSNPDAELTVDDLSRWEAAHGPMPDRCAVLMRSGWDARWPSQARFANADARGIRHFPGFSLSAIQRLAATREVLGIGVDTLSIDPGRDTRYEGHHAWSAANKWAVECLAGLAALPPVGATLFVGAPKVERASGGPSRVVAWVPRRSH